MVRLASRDPSIDYVRLSHRGVPQTPESTHDQGSSLKDGLFLRELGLKTSLFGVNNDVLKSSNPAVLDNPTRDKCLSESAPTGDKS